MTASGRDATMSVAWANLIAVAWLPVSGLLVLGLFIKLWGREPVSAAMASATDLRVFIPVMILSVVVHEALHAVGFLILGRAPRQTVRLGFQRRTLTPYASCAAPVPAGAYRGAALLPAIVLGILPALAAWALGSGGLALWAWVMLAIAGGDVAAVWAIRGVPGGVFVVDHPTRVGCRVT